MAGYIKFDGIDGESLDKEHKGWSDIISFEQRIHKPGTGTGVYRRRADVVFDDIVVSKAVDKASPKLAERVANGKVFSKVEIHVTRSYTDKGRQTYLIYELENVQVLSYDINGACQSADVPTEELSLNFEKIKVVYKEAGADGKEKGQVDYSWKVEEGES
ncbi:MAG: type VI secretion system tube protein Hcp [Planctomyces sp.]|nr:type VI secretion system tube protein Hcp [Planctomyces sp.]